MKLIKVEKSDKPKKKFMAIFRKDNGKEKKVYFGSAGMRDFTLISSPSLNSCLAVPPFLS